MIGLIKICIVIELWMWENYGRILLLNWACMLPDWEFPRQRTMTFRGFIALDILECIALKSWKDPIKGKVRVLF